MSSTPSRWWRSCPGRRRPRERRRAHRPRWRCGRERRCRRAAAIAREPHLRGGPKFARWRAHRRGHREIQAGHRHRSALHAGSGRTRRAVPQDPARRRSGGGVPSGGREEPGLPAGLVRPGVRAAGQGQDGRRGDRLRALHQAAPRGSAIPTTASDVPFSNWAERLPLGRLSRRMSPWRKTRTSTVGSNPPRRRCAPCPPSDARRPQARASGEASGSSKVKIAPCPSSLSTESAPPWAVAICCPM